MNGASGVGAVDGYETNVFINCPFDDEYQRDLLRPLLFTIASLGFHPRIAAERSDSGENRLSKICELIGQSKYSIHDISRLKAAKAGELSRMNMPFELGIDYGSRQYGLDFLKEKKCLILERKPHDFKIALSDLSGVDIKSHDNQPVKAVRAVRDWFYETVGVRKAPPPNLLWSRFNKDFVTDLFELRLVEGLSPEAVTEDIDKMPISEYLHCVEDWIASR